MNDHESGATKDWIFKIGNVSYRKARQNDGT